MKTTNLYGKLIHSLLRDGQNYIKFEYGKLSHISDTQYHDLILSYLEDKVDNPTFDFGTLMNMTVSNIFADFMGYLSIHHKDIYDK